MSKAGPKVDGFLRKSPQWRVELQALRTMLLDSELVEEVKWRHPCYTIDGGNVVLLGRQKECCTIGFIKGVLLADRDGVLELSGENSQSVRVIRVTSLEQVQRLASTIKAFIAQAIELEKSGAKVEFKSIEQFERPIELQNALEASPLLLEAFERLTPGRQRGYLMHIASAKQASTRVARVEKCSPRILEGKGMND